MATPSSVQPTQTRSCDVFIRHRTVDKASGRCLARNLRALRARGYRVFPDGCGLIPRPAFADGLWDGLPGAPRGGLVVGRETVESGWVRGEEEV